MSETSSSLPPHDSAEERFVRDEGGVLPPYSDDVWTGRLVPRGVLVPFRGQVGTPAPAALDASSLEVRHEGVVLRAGVDYLVDPVYGTLCLPTADAAPIAVTLDYRYTLLRIDSIVRDAVTGERRLLRGVSHLTAPHPPRTAPGERVEAHVLIDDRAEGPRTFTPESDPAPIPRAVGGLPRAKARVADGAPVRLLFLGDSITEGGDASTEEDTFRAVAVRAVREAHSGVDARVASTGGSRSVQWLDAADESCDWGRVVAAEPHVTVVEFLNDAYLDPHEWGPAYDELVARLTGLGSEVVLLTPPFVMRSGMHETETVCDGRPYVRFVREYAAANGLPLIDVSARWEALRAEGLPYWTLLANGINHPDDRGHRLTGEFVGAELQRMLGGEGSA